MKQEPQPVPRLALRLLLAASCLAATGFAQARSRPFESAPTAVGGVLDLTRWDPERDGAVTLAGEWRFVWNELVEPSRNCESPLGASRFAVLPAEWTGLEVDSESLPPTGYATYCLSVLLAPRDVPISVYFSRVKTAGALWIDGRAVAGEGTVGTSSETSRPLRIDHIASVAASERMEIVLQVSNFHFREGGPDRPILLGAPGEFAPLANAGPIILSMLFAGGFLVLGLYHLILHLIRRRSVAELAFALLCFVMALYQLTIENNLFHELFPLVGWTSEIRLEYSLFAVTVPLAAIFITAVFPREFSRSLTWATVTTSGVFLALVWTTPVLVSARWTLVVFQIFFLAAGLYGIWRVFAAIRNQRPGANWFLVGGGLWVIAGVTDGLLRRFADMPELLPYGFMAMIVAQSILLATAQEETTRRAEQLSTSLIGIAAEKLVLERAAYSDPLTGLDNRRRLDLDIQRLRRLAAGGEPEDGDPPRFTPERAALNLEWVSLLYLDVDDFKSFNDRFGHDVGDEILIRIADRIRGLVRAYDLSVRLGGDEFVVLLPGVDGDGAEAQAQRIRRAILEPMTIGDREIRVSVTTGVATVPADRVDLDRLLRRADRAMYSRKPAKRAP